jgi:hypothetical protein
MVFRLDVGTLEAGGPSVTPTDLQRRTPGRIEQVAPTRRLRARKEDRSMADPFDRVAMTLNRELAWLAGGLAALGGALVVSGVVAVDVLVRRHRDRTKHAA